MSSEKKRHAMRISYRVALGGIVAALCLVTMFLTGIAPMLYIAAPMVAGVLLLILVAEVGTSWALLTYVAVSLLSMVVTYDKEATLMFILFFGYYPLLRPWMNRISFRPLQLLVKLILFQLFLVVDYLLTIYVLGLPTFDELAGWLLPVLDVGAVIVFLIYEASLSGLTDFYYHVIRRRLMR